MSRNTKSNKISENRPGLDDFNLVLSQEVLVELDKKENNVNKEKDKANE